MTKQALREFFLRLMALFRLKPSEVALTEELEFHLAMKQRKYRAELGLSIAQAMAKARLELGGSKPVAILNESAARILFPSALPT